jgi:hypothetical protein
MFVIFDRINDILLVLFLTSMLICIMIPFALPKYIRLYNFIYLCYVFTLNIHSK